MVNTSYLIISPQLFIDFDYTFYFGSSAKGKIRKTEIMKALRI
jgi:hypothetical protein